MVTLAMRLLIFEDYYSYLNLHQSQRLRCHRQMSQSQMELIIVIKNHVSNEICCMVYKSSGHLRSYKSYLINKR